MEKDEIFLQRRELKKKSHEVIRKHYFLLTFLTLLLSFMGLEFSRSFTGWERIRNLQEAEAASGPGNVLAADDVLTYTDVWMDLVKGNLKEGESKAEQIAEKMQEDAEHSKALGLSEGVLASVVSSVFSGRLFVKMAQSVYTMTKSRALINVILILTSIFWYAFIFVFIKNVYSAVVRRVYLEARLYPETSFQTAGYFRTVKKWMHASWVMLVKYFFQTLWMLTIVGGVIKIFSYFAVPYIVAENPAVSAREAISLSRRMMYGHKWELFRFQLSLLGWILLGVITYGVADLAYGNSYRLACYTEFYVKVRGGMLKADPEQARILNDRWLFEKADRVLLYETYFDVVDEITDLHENRTELTGIRKNAAEWLGVWIGSLKQKRIYDDAEGRKAAIRRDRQCMEGKAYPQRLNPLWPKKGPESAGNYSYLRSYTIPSLILIFLFLAFIGWTWEVALHFIQTGEFANRGTLYGPWLPIYGSGGVVALILCTKFRKYPVLEFLTATTLCGIMEYFSGWFLEMKFHQRWWSYEGYFLNLHGRICAEGLLVFGVGCCAVVYLLAPVLDHRLSGLKQKVMIALCLVLGLTFGADVLYSSKNPNSGKGAATVIEEAAVQEDRSGTEVRTLCGDTWQTAGSFAQGTAV